MIGIIVSGHINFASGMKSAIDAIVGEQSAIEFIDFVPTITTEELEQNMLAAITKVNSGDGVLFLTDVIGGTPCNRAVALMLSRDDIKVIGGCNLPMITNACFERDDVSLQELSDIVLEIGQSTINDLHAELSRIEQAECTSYGDAL